MSISPSTYCVGYAWFPLIWTRDKSNGSMDLQCYSGSSQRYGGGGDFCSHQTQPLAQPAATTRGIYERLSVGHPHTMSMQRRFPDISGSHMSEMPDCAHIGDEKQDVLVPADVSRLHLGR